VRGALGWREAFDGDGGARLLLPPLPFSLEGAILASSVCTVGVSAGCFVVLATRLSRLRAMPLFDRL